MTYRGHERDDETGRGEKKNTRGDKGKADSINVTAGPHL